MSEQTATFALVEALRATRLVPVVEITRAVDAVGLARCLVEAGLPILEVTFRTAAAAEAIAAIRAAVPNCTVGAGTVLNGTDAQVAADAGAHFAVAPGWSRSLHEGAAACGLPLIPGASTASEVQERIEDGYTLIKFFPAEAAGGLAALKALAGPFAHTGIRFMPTGGVSPDKTSDYLALSAVAAVGGTWIAPRTAIADNDWVLISENVGTARTLAGQH